MASKETLIDELNFLSDKVSDRSRTVSAVVIAIWWAALVGEKSYSKLPADMILMPAALGVASLLFDFLQYIIGYLKNQELLKRIEATNETTVTWETTSLSYQLRGFLFYAKVLCAVGAMAWLVLLIGQAALS